MSTRVRPREAASLVLIRHPGRGAPEVLMGRRPPRSAFAPDVFVFPGGSLHAEDIAAPAALDPACARLAARSARRAGALAAAALRETREETGLSLTPDAPLTLIARAITPTNSPIRFHARFFHADGALASGELGGDGELADLAWRPLDAALGLPIMDVTEAVLRAVHAAEGQAPEPFLFSYRNGRPAPRPLRPKQA